MAAPTPTTRVTPAGIRLKNGHQTLITFARDPDISFWEKNVGVPGIDGGDAIDITTQHNTAWRTLVPRDLKTLQEFTVTAAYDPALYTQALNLIDIPDTVTIRFPDGSTLAFYGFLKGFEMGELVEGEFPECTLTVVPTNYDHVNNVEAAPVLASVAGT